ncbi:MAG: hypothetical protein ACKVH8_19245 [Pirellulales bacterium]|jgi:Arc/MetJ-type ribon-helix-helix transcriptional regulator
MEIEITAEQQAIIEGWLANGRFSSAEDAVSECIQQFKAQDQLRQKVQTGIDQADRGELIDHDVLFSHLETIASETQDPGQ